MALRHSVTIPGLLPYPGGLSTWPRAPVFWLLLKRTMSELGPVEEARGAHGSARPAVEPEPWSNPQAPRRAPGDAEARCLWLV